MANPASGWYLHKATLNGAMWRCTMKGSNSQQKTARPPFQPKPLSLEQESAVDLLLAGHCDREVAETLGLHRMTVQKWRTGHVLFMATLAQKREELFGVAVNRLRSLLTKALDNIAGAIEDGDVRSSFELLKATGLHGFCPPTGETDVQKLFDDEVMRQLARAKIPDKVDFLIDPLRNPEKERRKAEIEDELMAEYGE
jgi:Homeodomain-like domain